MTPSPTPSMDGEAGEASLAPCPFCGNDSPRKRIQIDESLWSHDAVEWLTIVCDECNCESVSSEVHEDVIAAWNRRAAIPALPPDTGKQALTDEQIDQVLGAAYRKLVLDTGYTGGMGSETWDRAAARAIEAEVLAASQPALDTGKQAENVYDLIPPSAAEWFANSPGIANHDWRGGWDACRNRARTLVEEYRAASKADERMRHDYPILQQFHTRHALGAMAAPSCLCCGHQTHPITRAIAVQHMELPAMVVCQQCKAAASQPAPTPDAAYEKMRLTLIGQVHELIDIAERHAWIDDPEERKRTEGAIAHARKVTAPYNYNGRRAASMQDTSSPQSPQGGA